MYINTDVTIIQMRQIYRWAKNKFTDVQKYRCYNYTDMGKYTYVKQRKIQMLQLYRGGK